MIRPLYLCAGTQSSGSTLVSWSFLQRSDMDGVLDARFDTLPQIPAQLSRPLAWCKFTIACFRHSEVSSYLAQEGWSPIPLLVVRDCRSVFNSLRTKSYGRNGITADDPPLRLRLARFLEDWKLFRDRDWPILGYEQFVRAPEASLQTLCKQLNLPWDPAMLTWPKPADQIADARYGNPTFQQTKHGGLLETCQRDLTEIHTEAIPPRDLEWLEETFEELNRAMGYPIHVPLTDAGQEPRAIPRFENTRRYERLQRKHRLSRSIKAVMGGVKELFGKRDAGVAPVPRPHPQEITGGPPVPR
jgi:hypothetical protein